MSAAAGATSQAEWFLARDGEQFGPLSDAELRKLVEMGHLKSSDLLWREGFPEWRSARLLLPEAGALKPVAVQAIGQRETPPVAGPQNQRAPVAEPLQDLPRQFHPQPSAPNQAAAPMAGDVAAVHHRSLAQRATDAAQAAMLSGPAAVAIQPLPQAGPAAQPIAQPLGQVGGYQRGQAGAAIAVPRLQPLQPHGFAPHQPTHFTPTMQSMPGQLNAAVQPAAPVADTRASDAARAAPRLGPQAAAPRRKSAAPVVGADFDDEDERPRAGVGRWILRVAVVVFFAATLSAAAWLAYPYRERILSSVGGLVPSGFGFMTPVKSPLVGFAATTEETDSAMQSAPLWRTLKREFPDWYAERVKEATNLAREQKSERAIGEQLMTAVVALRRKHAGDALSATSAKLKVVAAAFAENLGRLRKTSVDACHGFISAGEASPAYLTMLDDPAHTGALQAQLTAVFDAVGEGRKIPRIYPQPKQSDYNMLVALLEARGWKDADMQLFSDSRAFGKAEPEKVCRMVTDWFEAQLEIKDADAQLRLLADALKPVVAG